MLAQHLLEQGGRCNGDRQIGWAATFDPAVGAGDRVSTCNNGLATSPAKLQLLTLY